MATTEGLDDSPFVLFLDLLGFSKLVEAHPHSLVRTTDWKDPIINVGVFRTPSSSLYNRFHDVLDSAIAPQPTGTKPDRALIFSDCAFLVFETALQCAIATGRIMRHCVRQQVPVRMGLAQGTFVPVRFGSDWVSDFSIVRAMFSGTGVVWSNLAERRGGKGCRVFIHRLAQKAFTEPEFIRTLPLPTPNAITETELCYLYPDTGADAQDPIEEDVTLWRAVETMRQASEPMEVDIALQYSETFAALNRMRRILSRPPIGH